MIRISLTRPAAVAALGLLLGLGSTSAFAEPATGNKLGARVSTGGDTPEARAACQPDAMALCGQFVPDEKQITVCMTSQANRNLLSPACYRYIYGRNR
jgi:hypothetical protein